MEMADYYYYIIILAVAVLLIFLATYFIRKTKKVSSPQNPYIEALKRLIDRDGKTAFNLLEQAVKRGDAPTDAYIKLGELLRERGEAGKALQIHQSLTVKTNLNKGEKTELYRNLAEDYAVLGRADRSVSVLESAVKSSGIREPQIFYLLAKLYNTLGQRDKAFETLKDLKRHGDIGDRELALYLTSSAEYLAEPSDTGGDSREAKKLLQKALKLDPDCAPALLAVGNLEEADGNAEEAIRFWRRAATASQDLAGNALLNLEKTLFQKGRFGEIEQVYLDVLSVRKGDEAATLSLALFYNKQGREEDALRLLEEFHSVYPDSSAGLILLTSLYTKRKDDEALETFLNDSINRLTESRYYVCQSCGYKNETMRWHCPKCNNFDSFSTGNAN